ncbi:tetratricopeptide repeat protein [Ferriphaselus amnicola]|nr:hypothetical protein [Ferriphaselus amnicola]
MKKRNNGDRQGAMSDYNKGIELGRKSEHPDHDAMSYMHSDLAYWKCYELNDPQGAMEDYSEAIRHDELRGYGLSHLHSNRAKCMEEKLNDFAGARGDRQLAKEYSRQLDKRIEADRAEEKRRQAEAARAPKTQEGPSVGELNAEAARKKLKGMMEDHSYKNTPYYGNGCNGSSSCR